LALRVLQSKTATDQMVFYTATGPVSCFIGSRMIGKSAMGVFRWAESRSGYGHTQEAYDMLVDRLGKMKQMGKMKAVLEEMGQCQLVGLSTVAKVMRRFAGAGQWEEAVSLGRRLMSWELWGWRRIQSL
jgi:pentatricopeptide repeat protein